LAPYNNSENSKHIFVDDEKKEETPFINAYINMESMMADEKDIFEIDMNKKLEFDNKFKSIFNFKAKKDGEVGGFASWFTVEMIKGSFLSTSPVKE
jgi:hypothetical protein